MFRKYRQPSSRNTSRSAARKSLRIESLESRRLLAWAVTDADPANLMFSAGADGDSGVVAVETGQLTLDGVGIGVNLAFKRQRLSHQAVPVAFFRIQQAARAGGAEAQLAGE